MSRADHRDDRDEGRAQGTVWHLLGKGRAGYRSAGGGTAHTQRWRLSALARWSKRAWRQATKRRFLKAWISLLVSRRSLVPMFKILVCLPPIHPQSFSLYFFRTLYNWLLVCVQLLDVVRVVVVDGAVVGVARGVNRTRKWVSINIVNQCNFKTV